MSETKTDSKKAVEKTEEMARKIWLAGLGAYGQSVDNLHTGYEKMSDHAREYFEELVSRGEKLEKDTRSSLTSAGSKIRTQAEKNRDLLNKQIAELRQKVSSTSHYKDELLEELQGRVTKLTETLNKLIPAREKAAPARKTTTAKAAPGKTAAKKTTAKKSTSSAAKKTGTRTTKARTGTAAAKKPAAAKKTATREQAATAASTAD